MERIVDVVILREFPLQVPLFRGFFSFMGIVENTEELRERLNLGSPEIQKPVEEDAEEPHLGSPAFFKSQNPGKIRAIKEDQGFYSLLK